MTQMLIDSNFADAQCGSNLLITLPISETQFYPPSASICKVISHSEMNFGDCLIIGPLFIGNFLLVNRVKFHYAVTRGEAAKIV